MFVVLWKFGALMGASAVAKLAGQVLFSALVVLVALVYNPPPFSFPPSHYLDDPIFAPVDSERRLVLPLPPGSAIPPHLIGGKFFRNGPNPIVKSLPYHWFDGDGMLFTASFSSNESIVLENRWIRTALLATRNQTRTMRSFLAEIQYPWRALRALLSLMKSTYQGTSLRMTTGNTALLWHDKKLLALMEAAHPIEVDPVTLETRGPVVLPGVTGSFTAHPKYDPVADELISFGYIPPSSSLRYYVHKRGKAVHVGAVDFAAGGGNKLYSRMPHDFACTQKWSLFYDSPASRMHPMVMLGLSPAQDPAPARLVWVPRHNSSDLRWAQTKSGAVFHFANAWEEEDSNIVTLIGCRSNRTRFYFNLDEEPMLPFLYEWKIDVATNKLVSERHLLDQSGRRVAMEFPSVNERLATRKTRFTYGMAMYENGLTSSSGGGGGVVKYDHAAGSSTVLRLPGNWSYHEPHFVASGQEAEDEGSLVAFVMDRDKSVSWLLVLDAATMAQQALVPLGTRVPMGFHTHFLSRIDLQGLI